MPTRTAHHPAPPPAPPAPLATRPRALRSTEVTVAVLFLAATATFAAGDALLDRAPGSAAALHAGTAAAVAATGWLLLPVLRPRAPRAAIGYLLARGLEGLVLLAFALRLVRAGSPLPSYELAVYLVSAVAGCLLASALLGSGLVPRWLALSGMLGYASLAVGTGLDVLGVVDLTSATGAGFLAPGAVFEVVFPVLLLVRGFRR